MHPNLHVFIGSSQRARSELDALMEIIEAVTAKAQFVVARFDRQKAKFTVLSCNTSSHPHLFCALVFIIMPIFVDLLRVGKYFNQHARKNCAARILDDTS